MYPNRENSDAILSVVFQNPFNRQRRSPPNFHGPMELSQFVCPSLAKYPLTGLSSFRQPGLHFSVDGDQDLLSRLARSTSSDSLALLSRKVATM
jgi:hypothetical protein